MIFFEKFLNHKSYLNFNNFLFYKFLKKCYLNNGIALAFNQLSLRLNCFYIFSKNIFFFNNCFLYYKSKSIFILSESCLSFKGIFLTYRNKFICFLSFYKKRIIKIFLKNFYSVCFQHEYSHTIGFTIKAQ
ncbi:peptide deformylase [Candidatus Vidania fulgoroideorum]